MARLCAGRVVLHSCFPQGFGRPPQRTRVKEARPSSLVASCFGTTWDIAHMNFAERLFLPVALVAGIQMMPAYGAEIQAGRGVQKIHLDIQISPSGSGCGQSGNAILPDEGNLQGNPAAIVPHPPSPPPTPPPPVPPESISRDPRRLVRYFCGHWKDENFTEMYYSMTPAYRKKTTLEKSPRPYQEIKPLIEEATIAFAFISIAISHVA